ncbi:MAG: gliding motility-associated C-terminal domain-containing protein [Bacteroidales bacterium]|nr:gliding motility-associated C-terminal domain-containing protein [Bacteroidales bacterium]
MRNQLNLNIALLFFLLLFSKNVGATHNRAGEITYKHISGYTFEVTVSTYTNSQSEANRDRLVVYWGDGTYETVFRDNTPVFLPNSYQYQTYTARHTYPGPGIYQILMEDPNRNLGINNIPNSVNTLFSIKTTMLIGTFSGTNTTPVLLNPPIDRAARGHLFIHNPAAYDVDGDSISYELTVCTAENGQPIPGYEYPPYTDTLYINNITGDLVWDTPVDTGAYNIAIFINEWRDGVKIGRISRDMQVNVYNTNNNPPVNSQVNDYCVEAGDTIMFEFTCTDADNDLIEFEMRGGPLTNSNAYYEILEAGAGYINGRFVWATSCNDAREQPYSVVLKSNDKVIGDISLVDISSFEIKVLHNSPENLKALPGTDTIRVEWDVTDCGLAAGYNIYRRVGYYGFVADSCENGVPEYTGYKLLAKVPGKNTNFFTDDNNGLGLVPGFDYCYIVTAYYNDNAESFASEEVCTTLIPGVPSMLQVSVLSDSETNGSVLVGWAKPVSLDTMAKGPYQYRVYRQAPGETVYSQVAVLPTASLSDTTYIDNSINTLVYPYYYSVKLFYTDNSGNWAEYPGSETASSLYIDLAGKDNAIGLEMKKRSPWLNYEYQVYRKPDETSPYELVARITENTYTDSGLPNGVPFTYRAISKGTRPVDDINYFVENISHINTTSAIDSFPPCAPELAVMSMCDSSYNFLRWTSPFTVCGSDDVVSYRVYYRPRIEGSFEQIATVMPPDTTFLHSSNLETLAAVYGVSAVDSFGNESNITVTIIDTCIMYALPNVFSPDGDGINDIYTAYNPGGFVKTVDMKIYNRYGQLVFETTNANIEWNGDIPASKKRVSPGVYYYICDVFEPRLTGESHITLKGFIHVFSGEKTSIQKE